MKKILVVDDAAFMRKATTAMLSPKYEVVCAGSGTEAMELYEKEHPDMILTDIIMPEMTGLELQQKLQERYNEMIPIMFMTADDDGDTESRGLQEGALDYIRKPFRQDVLLRRVENIMRYVDRIAGLKQVATVDPMTGLLNKTAGQSALADACLHHEGALMMVDLDSFKLVNDLFGHSMGDKVLIRFADILRRHIRSADVAARMGGDEFMVFCKEIREENVLREKTLTMNREILEMARELMGKDMNIPLGVSVGAALAPDEGKEFQELFQKADKALYQVKQSGRHNFALYHSGGTGKSAGTAQSNAGIDVLQTILEERNRGRGAYVLGSDAFQAVYRFVVRSIENYRRRAMLILFTLAPGQGDESAPERFGEILSGCLRRSDVYCHTGTRQYAVLLSEMDETGETVVLTRILDLWQEQDGGKTAVTHESRILHS